MTKGHNSLRMLAGLFSESAHETWTRGEIINIIEDAIRLGGGASIAATPTSLIDVRALLQAIYDLIDDEEAAEPLDYAIAHAKKALIILDVYTHSARSFDTTSEPIKAACNHENGECIWYGREVQYLCKHCNATLTYSHDTTELVSVSDSSVTRPDGNGGG